MARIRRPVHSCITNADYWGDRHEYRYQESRPSTPSRWRYAARCCSRASPRRLPAQAQDDGNDDVKALIYPLNYLDVGVRNVPTDSPKFGEYNGLNDSGAYLLGEFRPSRRRRLRAGRRHDALAGDAASISARHRATLEAQRRAIRGTGTSASDYDQLRHYTTDGSYQTPFQGSHGRQPLHRCRPSFGVINTTTTNVGRCHHQRRTAVRRL